MAEPPLSRGPFIVRRGRGASQAARGDTGDGSAEDDAHADELQRREAVANDQRAEDCRDHRRQQSRGRRPRHPSRVMPRTQSQ